LSLINNESGNRFSKSHAEMLFTVLILLGTSLNQRRNKWKTGAGFVRVLAAEASPVLLSLGCKVQIAPQATIRGAD
jgi:hypothetical protein